MTQLLTSYVPLQYDRNMIMEQISKNGTVILKNAILQRANSKNQNGRVYPMPILQREVMKYQQEFIAQRRALGELDHPESPVVNLKNVSHNILNCHFQGEDLMGDVEVLSTPSGNILKEFLKNNIRLGVSSRGLGSVKELGEGVVEVGDDFTLICFDIVSNPSTQGAFLNESVEAKTVSVYTKINELVYDFFNEIR